MSISPISASVATSLFGSYAGIGSNKAAGSPSAAKSPEQQFLDMAKMSPAEQMRASILKSMGLTEDDLKAMTPDARKAAEESIAQKIKDQVMQDSEKKSGLLTDIKA